MNKLEIQDETDKINVAKALAMTAGIPYKTVKTHIDLNEQVIKKLNNFLTIEIQPLISCQESIIQSAMIHSMIYVMLDCLPKDYKDNIILSLVEKEIAGVSDEWVKKTKELYKEFYKEKMQGLNKSG